VTERNTRIRPVGAFDIALLAELHKATFTAPWDRPWSAESLAQILAMPGAGGWLLESDALPIGFVLVRFTLDEGEILLTGILPAALGQGHGIQLMQATIEAARAAGIAKLFLEHAELNIAAARLYERLGFVQIGRRAQYYSAHQPPARHYDAVTRVLDLSVKEPAAIARVDTRESK
jgi:ribosomal-protein-alanine N-acetyltransferase